MAIKYGFFNSMEGDRKYTAADIGEYLHGIITNGVYADASDSLQVISAGGMAVEVQPGRAMLNYKFLQNDAPMQLTLAQGTTQNRIDAIVARMDLNDRLCEIAVKEGTPAATPVPPVMARTDTVYEIMLASVYVARLATTITQSAITDTRADNTVCGYVVGAIQQLDTSTLFEQYRAANEEYLEEQAAAWETFFANVEQDTVIPVPSPADAGKSVTVNAEGTGYDLIDTKLDTMQADTTLYVATTGSDTTGKGTEAQPYASIQAALDSLPKNLGGHVATVYIAEGSYTEAVKIANFYGGRVTLTGSTTGAVTINGQVTIRNSNVHFEYFPLTVSGNYIYVVEGGRLFLGESATLTCTGGTYGLYARYNSKVSLGGDVIINNTTSYAVRAGASSDVYIHNVSGSGNKGGFYAVGGSIRINANSLTATTLYVANTGGRVYMGAQSNAPQY